MSYNAPAHVYTGTWINWSHGRVLGSTLTMSQSHGNLLTAFLGIFVASVGAAWWRIMCYIIHQLRAKDDLRDGLHHQHQVILRNSDSPGSTSWRMLQLVWAWRRLHSRALLRTLPLICLAFLNIVLFTLAGIFSSRVSQAAGDETLVQSPTCGYMQFSGIKGGSGAQRITNQSLAASQYERNCYRNLSSYQCDQYTTSAVPFKSSQTGSCPFAKEVCANEIPILQLDSGLLDSHDILGVNAPPSDRLQYRQLNTCAVINATAYMNTTHRPASEGNSSYLEWNFTSSTNGDPQLPFMFDLNDSDPGYKLKTLVVHPNYHSESLFPAFNRSDADISFIYVSQLVKYETNITDPFFGPVIPAGENSDDTTMYIPDFPVSFLGCVDQNQYCNPNNGRCTAPSGFQAPDNAAFSQLQLNTAQNATAYRFAYATQYFATAYATEGRGASSLRASELLISEGQGIYSLPDTQWQSELQGWFGVSMARLQQLMVEYATGPSYLPDGVSMIPLNTAEEHSQCQNQKIRNSNGYMSFSVLGIALIIALGTLIIIVNLFLDILVGKFMMKRRWKTHKTEQWWVDEKLHLQRLAYEASGQGQWNGKLGGVPTTLPRERFGYPVNADLMRPSFKLLQQDSTSSISPRRQLQQEIAYSDKAPSMQMQQKRRLQLEKPLPPIQKYSISQSSTKDPHHYHRNTK